MLAEAPDYRSDGDDRCDRKYLKFDERSDRTKYRVAHKNVPNFCVKLKSTSAKVDQTKYDILSEQMFNDMYTENSHCQVTL